MAHEHVIILGKTRQLREAAVNAGDEALITKLDDLKAGAEALESKLIHNDPHSAQIEEVMENLQAWLEGTTFAATDFAAELDTQIAAMQLYLP